MIIFKKSEIEILDKLPDGKLILYSDNPDTWKKMQNNKIKPFQSYHKKGKLIGHGYIVSKDLIQIK
jgi:hypothetical protein